MERLFLTCDLTRIHLDALLTIGQHLSEAAATLLPEGVATAPVAELDEALEALGLAMRQPQTKRGAANRLAADLAVEETWRGFVLAQKAMTLHPDPVRREAARSIYALARQVGYLTDLGKQEKYGRLRVLMGQLDEMAPERLALARADDWAGALRERIESHEAADKALTAMKDEIQSGLARAARGAVERAMRQLLSLVEARAIVEGATAYEAFANRVNTLIAEAKAQIKSRESRALGAAGEADNDEPQPK